MIPIFHNPNENWQGYDPYKGMNDKERMRVGCWGASVYVMAIIVAMALCFLFNRKLYNYAVCQAGRTSHRHLGEVQQFRDSIFVRDLSTSETSG